MAFQRFFKQSAPKDPETIKREMLIDHVVKDILLPHDSRDMLSSRYLNKMYDGHEPLLDAAIDSFEGSPAEKLVSSAATPLTEIMAKAIAVVGHALLNSGVIDKLHVSDKLVDRSTLVKTILERLLNKHIGESEVRQKLMPLASLFQAEYNALKQAVSPVSTVTCAAA